jgi:hypothetical protein
MPTLSHIVRAAAATASLLVLGACAPIDEPLDDGADETQEAAASAELSAKADGITVWLDPVAYPTERFDQPAWRLEGRASKNLASVFAFSADDEFGEAIQTSARKFDVFVDAGQLEHLLAGYRLLLDIKTTTGSQRQYFASIRLAPKLERFHGSSKIVLHKTFTPFVFGSEVRFRNVVGLASGYADATATTDVGGGPIAVGPTGTSVAMDWLAQALMDVSADASHEIDVSASNSGVTVTRSGALEIDVTSLQLSTKNSEAWMFPTCQTGTLECLRALPPGILDRSSCGKAIEVLPCLSQLAPNVSGETFSVDLAAHLVGWYELHGADVAASGGNTLEQAQERCEGGNVSFVLDPADDPEGHDLSQFIVVRHPDVVWPGSDIVWFGAYDRATGALVSIYDFN